MPITEKFEKALTEYGAWKKSTKHAFEPLIEEDVRNRGGIEKTILELEENYRVFREKVHRFSELPDVRKDADELAYICIFMEDFEVYYMQIVGLATLVGRKEAINPKFFKKTYAESYSIYTAFQNTLGSVFEHSLKMLEVEKKPES